MPRFLATVAALAALAAGPALPAVSYPKPVSDQVNDFAGVIERDDEEAIIERTRDALRSTGVPIAVVTIPSLADYLGGEAWTIERYAAGLYNEWGIGSPPANKGVLLLVSVGDRKLRIATGAGFGSSWDGPSRRIIDEHIVPRLRRGDMSAGIRAGVDAIARELAGGGIVERPPGGTAPAETPAGNGEGGGWTPHGTGVGPPSGRRWGIGTLIFFGSIILGIFALISFFRGIFRRVTGGVLGGSRGRHVPGAGGGGMGGWGGLLTGGLLGYLGSRMLDGFGRRSGGGSAGSSASQGGSGSSWGGGGFSSGGGSFGGGYSSGGGATGSW